MTALIVAGSGCRKKSAEPTEAPPATPEPTERLEGEAQAPATETASAGEAEGGEPEPGESTGAPAAGEGGYLLERVGDYTVLRMHPEGFAALPLEQKILAYHLYRAAIAGDLIMYDQRYRHNVDIKVVLEAVVQHPEGVDTAVLERIRTYLKLFWINHGVHDGMNGDKVLPEFTFDDLLAAVRTVIEHGTPVLDTTDTGEVAERLEDLRGPMFDPEVDPFSVRKFIPEGLDLVTASSNSYYENVTLAEVEAFDERFPLNSRVAKRDGVIVELPYRAGSDDVEPGLYAGALAEVVRHLDDALPFAGAKQREALEHLIRYFRTGDPQAFREYNVAWVSDSPPVDAILGFIEVYGDPRGQKGAWEGVVFIPDVAGSEAMGRLAENAAYFESVLPYAEEYKRSEFQPPVANRIFSIVHTGDAGPISPAGINLPNAQDIREQYGSKSVDIANLGDAVENVTGHLSVEEFAFDEAERELGARCLMAARQQIIQLHEVVGHGSGRKSASLEGDPADHLPGLYNTIEEARADLVALYLAQDPKLVELGILPSADCAAAVGQYYLRGALLMMRRLPEGGIIEEDHWRAEMLIVKYAFEKGAARVEQRDGRFYFVMGDPAKWWTVIGELLAEIMRIKAEGDYEAAKHLVETYGSRYEPAWREDVMARVRSINYPLKYAFVSPILRAVTDDEGNITDVVAEPAESLEAMEWEWNRLNAP